MILSLAASIGRTEVVQRKLRAPLDRSDEVAELHVLCNRRRCVLHSARGDVAARAARKSSAIPQKAEAQGESDHVLVHL